MRALAAATRYGQWRAKDHGTPVAPAGINRRIAEDVVQTVLSVDPKGRRLTHDEAAALLQAYGIDVWGKEEARSADEAVAAAERVGYPVVLKSTAPMLRHQGGRRRRCGSTCAPRSRCATRGSRSPSGSPRSTPTASSCRRWPPPGCRASSPPTRTRCSAR